MITGVFIASFGFIITYVLFTRYIASRFVARTDIRSIWELPAVSILIPARNEEMHIAACLNSILHQEYDHGLMELILVDDGSSDGTIEKAKDFEGQLNLKILNNDGAGKKQALQTGIKHSQHHIIVTVDADCKMEKDWLRTMMNEFVGHDLNMLCGLIQLNSSGLFQDLQQAESAAIVGISAVMLNEQQPCTCNGANLVFRKDVYEHLGGYGSHAHLLSGDDDLLMQQFARLDMNRTRYLVHSKTVVRTEACISFKEFLQQRSRWLSKRKAYVFPYNQLLQAIVALHLIAFYSLIFLLFMPHGEYAALIIILKYLADLYYGLKLRKVIPFKLRMILLMPFYQLYIFIVLVYARFIKVEWKGN